MVVNDGSGYGIERLKTRLFYLWQIERGIPSVAMGAYFQVLFVLGPEKDFLKLGSDDELGRKFQDAGLLVNQCVPRK